MYMKNERSGGIWAGVCTTLQLLLGVLFCISSWPKLQFPFEFLSGIYDYQICGKEMGVLLAAVLPPAEMAVGVLLVLDILVIEALLLLAPMLLLFIGVQGYALAAGLKIACSCFGSATGESPIDWISIARTSGLFVVAVALLWHQVRVMRRVPQPREETQ